MFCLQRINCETLYVGYEGESKPSPTVVWTSAQNGKVIYDYQLPNRPRTRTYETTTAQFEPPTNCTITDNENQPIKFKEGQNVLPDPDPTSPVPCIETPMLRNQVGGFVDVDGSFTFDNLRPGLYAIEIEIENDLEGTKPGKLKG